MSNIMIKTPAISLIIGNGGIIEVEYTGEWVRFLIQMRHEGMPNGPRYSRDTYWCKTSEVEILS